jgi:hypothetical protein
MVIIHPCRFASLLVFAPASSCGGGRLSCIDRRVVRIKPHHLDGGGQVSWVDIGPHPSTEGRGQDGGTTKVLVVITRVVVATTRVLVEARVVVVVIDAQRRLTWQSEGWPAAAATSMLNVK